MKVIGKDASTCAKGEIMVSDREGLRGRIRVAEITCVVIKLDISIKIISLKHMLCYNIIIILSIKIILFIIGYWIK